MGKYKRILTGMVMVLYMITGALNLTACGDEIKAEFDADAAMDAFNKAFYYVIDGNGYYSDNTDGGVQGFWSGAEIIEVLEDAYDRTRDDKYKKMIIEACGGFINKFGTDWTSNKYNDDIMWMVLVCERAYGISGDKTYLDLAKYHFDQVYSRGYSSELGGGLWWTTDCREKNTCINCPAAIAALKLYELTNESAYLDKAKDLYEWEVKTLFESSTGSVYDNIKADQNVEKSNYTYNQGTFIGASCLLYKITKEPQYLENAKIAADYTKNNMCTDGILKDEGDIGDGSGFKGIFSRYIKMLINDCGQTQYKSWMQKNANTVWKNRRESDNLTYAFWGTKCPETTLYAFGCSTGVALLQNCPAE